MYMYIHVVSKSLRLLWGEMVVLLCARVFVCVFFLSFFSLYSVSDCSCTCTFSLLYNHCFRIGVATHMYMYMYIYMYLIVLNGLVAINQLQVVEGMTEHLS